MSRVKAEMLATLADDEPSGNLKEADRSGLLYVRRKLIYKDNFRNAIFKVLNAIFRIRLQEFWSDFYDRIQKILLPWDQNLMTDVRTQYRGRDVMI